MKFKLFVEHSQSLSNLANDFKQAFSKHIAGNWTMDWKEVNFDPKYSFHNRLSFTGRGIHKNDVFLATVDVVVDKAAGDDVDNLQYDHATGNKFLKFFVNLRREIIYLIP
jgi:hypothetical protein